MNKKLKLLYESYWNDLLTNSKDTKAAHPLLIMVDNDYKEADIKVMIVGQETDKWHGLLEEKQQSVDFLMDDYYHYLYNINSEKNNLSTRLTKKRKRTFWNRNNFKFYTDELNKIFPTKKVSFVWNNVSKIGKCACGKATTTIADFEEKNFEGVFQQEVEILQPDIIIFVSGDRKIPIKHYPIKKIKYEQVSEVKFEEYPNIIAFRTYHPNAKIAGGKKHLKNQIIQLTKTKFPDVL